MFNTFASSSAASNFPTRGIRVVTRSMAKQMLEASKMTNIEESEVAASNSNAFKPTKASSTIPNTEEVPVMMVNASTIEEQMANMMTTIEILTKQVQEQQAEIMRLRKGKGESSSTNHEHEEEDNEEERTPPQQRSASEETKSAPKQSTNEEAKSTSKGFHVSSDGLIQVDQLKEFIEGALKSKFGESSRSSFAYSKPYTQRIDDLKMPMGYQPPKFQQFDGKGNPRQHIAHFIETCNNAGTYGDHLVKQFVRSLKGNAFDWYTDLESNSLDSWGQLEHEFLNRFYSTRRTVSMVELTNTRQWKEEPVIDYINRWRNLCLNCRDRLSEASAIEMCIQGMKWSLQYILKGIQPRTFEDLATRAHDMEMSMAASGMREPPVQECRKWQVQKDFNKRGNSVDEVVKESMAVKVTPLASRKKENNRPRQDAPQERMQRKLTLKEMQQKEYPFLNSDVPGIFDDLLEANLIELPEMKRPQEADQVDNPKYCKYHRLVGHSIEDCFIFKDKVVQLERAGKISLEEEGAATNMVTLEQSKMVLGSSSQDKSHLHAKEKSVDEDLMSAITFTNEDLELGFDSHNRPLFVSGYTREQRVNRILVDGGSAVNILPLRTLKKLGVLVDELSGSRLVIQGFNHEGQRALGTIVLDLLIEDMSTVVLFHVIDAKTSYNMLLGRPWLHENGVVPSTWHQCFKYLQDGVVKKIIGDNNPFEESESHLADAKYYRPSKPVSETNKIVEDDKENVTLAKDKSLEGFTLPLTMIDACKPVPAPLEGFVRPTQGDLVEHGELSTLEVAKNYGPKAFSLLVKAGYGSKAEECGPRVGSRSIAKLCLASKSSKRGSATSISKEGLGFTSKAPIRISIKRATIHHIFEGEESSTEDALDGSKSRGKRLSVFKRLGPLNSKNVKQQQPRIAKVRLGRQPEFPKLRSLVPSRMKRQTTLTISCGRVLKAKRQTIVFTNTADDRESVASSSDPIMDEEVVSSYHIASNDKVVLRETGQDASPCLREDVDR